VRDRVLDAELAALLWLTVEGGIPVVVAGGAGETRRAVRDALLPLVSGAVPVVHLAGADEDFAWMPQAGELGWRSSGPTLPGTQGAVMVADLEPGDARTWGEAAHLAIRALTAGYSLVATAGGSTLEDVLGRLSLPPVSAIDDELARLGVVLLLDDGPRVRIAHYLRPAARDPGGPRHVEREDRQVRPLRVGRGRGARRADWAATHQLRAGTGAARGCHLIGRSRGLTGGGHLPVQCARRVPA